MENSGDGIPSMIVSLDTGRRSLYPEDDGGGAELQGETDVAVQLPRVKELPDKG